jgi:hypothetical protein
MAKHGHGSLSAANNAEIPALGALALITQPAGTNALWLGGAGGNGDWNTAADWQGGKIPGATGTATFATGDAAYTVTGDATVGAIVVDGDGVTFDGTLTEGKGGPATFLTGTDDASVTLDANSFVTGGAISFDSGTLFDVQGVLFTTGGTADVMLVDGLSGEVISSGGVTVNQLYVENGGNFTGDLTLKAGGNLTLDTSSQFGGGSLTLLGNALIYEAAVAGGGTCSVADNIAFGAAGTTLNLASDPGATLLLSGNITGAGNVLASGGSVELSGNLDYTGTTAVQNGTLTIDNLTAVISSAIVVNNGELAFAGAETQSAHIDTVYGAGSSDTVSAGGERLLVYAGLADLNYFGGAGGSVIVGDKAAMTVTGGSDAGAGHGDLIYSGAGQLTFIGGVNSHDTILGQSGQVIATGGSGADLIYGGTSGHDILTTGAGNTTLVGGAGTRFYANGGGNDVIVAGKGGTIDETRSYGSDLAFTGTGNATILGGYAGSSVDVVGSGNTSVYGGSGHAEVFGGGGHVQVYLTKGFGGGTIELSGVTLSKLDILLVNYAPGEAQQALAHDTVAGGNTYLTLSDNTHIELFGVTGLTAANFS